MTHNLPWFTARIGKRIYRDSNECTCNDCKRITKEGLVITDIEHAQYIFNVQNDYGVCGVELNYRDTL